MSELAIEFKQESFYGDILEVTLGAGEITRAGFELFYRISARRNEQLILVAYAKTGMICYDYQAKKITMIPPELSQILSK